MGEERYFYSTEKDDVELDRLARQASIFDPITIRHFESIGVAEGWRCLEVGAGAGSIAEWLASRVGSAGRVVATDIDTRFLNRLMLPNLDVRRHDILKDELEKEKYDLVHCRCLLMHLNEPEKALNRMNDALRPGGWLLVEEHDWGSMLVGAIAQSNDAVGRIMEGMREFNDYLVKNGIIDQYYGRKVRGLVEQLGLADLGQEGYTYIIRGGDPAARGMSMPQLSHKVMIDKGFLTKELVDDFRRLMLDPAFYFPGPTVFAAWGRKPRVGE